MASRFVTAAVVTPQREHGKPQTTIPFLSSTGCNKPIRAAEKEVVETFYSTGDGGADVGADDDIDVCA